MQTMYPGKVNSPQTELAADIAETDTEIELLDVSVLPDAPNLVVILAGEMSETIRYGGIEGSRLTGVTRGFQGEAQNWGAGTKVARYFTAYDHNTTIGNITELRDRLDSAETADLTLQPGLQVVNAAKDARFNLGQIEGKTEINYDGRIGLIGVENLYAIRHGENLLPPFYEWAASRGTPPQSPDFSVDSLTFTAPSAGASFNVVVKVVSGQQYTAALEDITEGFRVRVGINDGGTGTFLTDLRSSNKTQTLSIPDDVTELIFAVSALLASEGPATFPAIVTLSGLRFTPGSAPKPFKPREDSFLAFQTELHANPDDGSDPDVLFEREGQYFKLAKWKKTVLSGAISWRSVVSSGTGYKAISADGFSDFARLPGTSLLKFDGSMLEETGSTFDTLTGADQFYFSITAENKRLYLTISNSDSGWGADYTPTIDEIKAYFMGWKMYPYGDAAGATAAYNGTGTKGWCYRIDGKTGNTNSDYTGGVSTLPTTQAPGYTPYQLVYRLATPTVEPVVSEGSLTLIEGDNQVEVGTGIVLRESVRVNSTSGISYINADYPFNSKPYDIKEVYRENYSDPEWKVSYRPDTDPYYERNGRAFAYIPTVLYDTSAAYSVTYLKLDKSPIQPFTGILAANEKAQISDLTAGVAEALQRVSVVEQKKAEKDSPGWIIPTLLNGWEVYGSPWPSLKYYKDSNNIVRIIGAIKNGTGTMFTLPKGYRPLSQMGFTLLSFNGSTVVPASLNVQVSGTVNAWHGVNNSFVLIDISFLAEQ